MTESSQDRSATFELCEAQPNSGVLIDQRGEEEEITVLNEGYGCPSDAVGKYRINTHAGTTMTFWFCEEHRERHSEAIVEEVTPDGY